MCIILRCENLRGLKFKSSLAFFETTPKSQMILWFHWTHAGKGSAIGLHIHKCI